jgi:dTDP-4-dehydrorhamnose 3,5-epimerase
MIFLETPLQGAYVVEPEPFRDERGFFARTFCKQEFARIDHTREFVQFNHSMTYLKGTLRGMHYQVPPSAEIKLIRCIRGKVFDVIIDIRKNSKTFLTYFSVILSEDNMKMVYVPEGFAHGFQTLEDNSQMIYHHTEFYTPRNERGLNYKDPAMAIKWPLDPINVTTKDQEYPVIDTNFKGIEL